MLHGEPTIFLVAGDPMARRNLSQRLKSLQLSAKLSRSVEEFFQGHDASRWGCILLSVSQPHSDLELLCQLGPRESHRPVIAVAGKADVPLAVRAMKLGALDFLEESELDEGLERALKEALHWDADHRRRIAHRESVARRLARLTPGQRQVLELIVAGKTNREIGTELELSVRAVEVRRSKIMEIMRAKSLAQLVRLMLRVETE